MKRWQAQEKHETEVRKILKENGCYDKNGFLRFWNGKIVTPILEKAGHDCLSFIACSCYKKIDEDDY